MDEIAAQILEALRRLTAEGGHGAFCIVSGSDGERYVQFTLDPDALPGGPVELYCEVASGLYQDPPVRILSTEQAAIFGFLDPDDPEAPGETQNYWRYVAIASDGDLRALAGWAAELGRTLLGWDPDRLRIERDPGG